MDSVFAGLILAFALFGAAFSKTLVRWHFPRASEARRAVFARAYRFAYLTFAVAGVCLAIWPSLGSAALLVSAAIGAVRVIGAFIVAPDS